MPNSNLVDERVVRMRMDNDQFEKGAERTIGTVEKLKKSLKFEDTKLGELNTSAIEKSLDKIQNKFNALQVAGRRMAENLADSLYNMAKQALTGADQISPGFNKYEQQVAAVQKLMIATGEEMEAVQKISDKILEFTDETSYEYSAMLNTMSSFTSSGMGMDKAADTILGMAIAAGQAGVNAKDATHAFMGFQKAISSGYMQSANWDWIRTAGMNSAELKKNLLEAAVATGDLQKGADGVYYAIKETTKGAQQIAVSVENFEQSFANKWLSGDAITLAMSKYSKAFNQIMEIHQQTGKEIFEIIDEDSPYIKYIDEYGLAAFRAGQETKTWSDAMESLKSAVSSGWMKSFELIIGNYKQASGFFSDLIEPLYQIFVNPGKKRNQFLEAAFGGGGGVKKTVVNWNKLKNKIEETGHSVSELEAAFKKVVTSSENEEVKALSEKYRDLEEAIKSGAVSGEVLNEILNSISGVTTNATDAMVQGAVDATQALEQYKEVAMEVLRGDYGNGQDRKEALEAMGLDYDTIQWLVGNLANGKGFDAITLEWFQTVAPNAYQHFIDTIGNGNVVIDGATGELIELGDVVDEIGDKMEGMTGRELWQGGVINIIQALADAFDAVGEAFDEVFGTAAERGKGFRGLLERFYRLTTTLTISEEGIERVKNAFVSFFKIVKTVPSVLGRTLKTLKNLKSLVFVIIDKVLSLFTGGHNANNQFGTLGSILEKIGTILGKLWDKAKKLLDLGNSGISGLTKKIKDFSFKDFFKPITAFLSGDSPFAQIIRDLSEPFQKLFGGEGSLFEKIKKFFAGFKESSDGMSRSIDDLKTHVDGLQDTTSRVAGFMGAITDGMTGDEKSFKEKVGKLFENIKKFVSEKYKSINWDTLLSAGKMGIFGLLIYRVNEFSRNINKTIKSINATGGPLGSLRLLVTNLTAPFTALSQAITKGAQANRYLSIALAIGVLAGSLYLLTKIGDDQAFFNAVVSLGLLMLLMSKMAKNLNGLQLFSNNTKNVSKNNPITNTVKAFENLKSAFSIDLTNAKFNFNVFSQTAQVLIGIAVAIVAIIHAFNQIRDIKSLEEVRPALIIIGLIMGALAVVVTLVALASEKAKYAGKMSVFLIVFVLAISKLIESVKSFGKELSESPDALKSALIGTIGIIMAIIALAAILMIAQGAIKSTGGGKGFIYIAATMIALGICVNAIVKAVKSASKIENVGSGLAVVAAVLVALVTVMAIMAAIASDTWNANNIVKIAASMIILSVALLMLAPAVAALAALDPKHLMAAAGAMAIVAATIVLMGAGIAAISKMLKNGGIGKFVAIAAILMLLSVAFTAVMFGITSFTGSMIALSQLPWVQLKAGFQAMHDVLAPELPLFLGLGLAAAMLGVGLLGAAAASGIFGLSFLAIAAGIYLVSAALPMLIDGIIYVMDQLQTNGWKIVGFIGLVLTAILLVMMARKAQFIQVIGSYAEALITFLSNSAFLKKLFVAVGTILLAVLTFMRTITPDMVNKVIEILVTFINSLAESIRSNKGDIVSAFFNLIQALLELVWEALKQALGLLGRIGTKIKEFLGDMGIGSGIITAYALDTDNVEIISDPSSLEAKAEEAAKENEQVAADAYSAEISNGIDVSDLSLEEAAQLSDEDADAWLLAAGVPSSDDLGTAATEKGTEDAALVEDSYMSGMMTALGGGLDTSGIGLTPGSGEFGMDSMIGSFGFGSDSYSGVSGNVMNFLSGSLGGPEALGVAGESGTNAIGSFIGNLNGGLSDSVNLETMMGGIRSFFGSTFGGEETTAMFNTGGTNLATETVSGISEEMQSETSYNTLYTAAQYDNNAVAEGWYQQSDLNVPVMVSYLIGGIENVIYNDANVKERLKSVGAQIYYEVERGMRRAAGINSPSKEMAKNGMYLMMGFVQGIENGEADAESGMAGVTNDLLSTFQSALMQVIAMMDQDMSLQPTITPVVDLSNIQNAASAIDSSLGSDRQIAASITNGIRNQATRATSIGMNRNSNADEFTNTNMTINVYPSSGMDERELADRVMHVMAETMQRRRAAIV